VTWVHRLVPIVVVDCLFVVDYPSFSGV
jgi:hypothetical protein